jgi:hypothetical protein
MAEGYSSWCCCKDCWSDFIPFDSSGSPFVVVSKLTAQVKRMMGILVQVINSSNFDTSTNAEVGKILEKRCYLNGVV